MTQKSKEELMQEIINKKVKLDQLITAQIIKKVCDVFNVSIDDLLEEIIFSEKEIEKILETQK